MLNSLVSWLRYHYKKHPILVFLISLSFGITILIFLSLFERHYRAMGSYSNISMAKSDYPFAKLKNLVMVAGHSVYTSSSCGKVDKEDSWFLEAYQSHPGQAATFVTHIKDGVEVAAKDEMALLLFSGGETRKEAALAVKLIATGLLLNRKHGNEESVKWRALTEEHARDSFENLLFSVCRFRELTGAYPENITVVSYDFKEERFSQLHRSAIHFPESRFFYMGTPASFSSKEAALKGEALVRLNFKKTHMDVEAHFGVKNSGVTLFTDQSHILMAALKSKVYLDIVDKNLIQAFFLGHSNIITVRPQCLC